MLLTEKWTVDAQKFLYRSFHCPIRPFAVSKREMVLLP